ncbi:MAG: hypothetical protein JWO11_3522 [Nocardioides sp.]|nr:hypothetical protein [Nocardioides sp.]
MSNLVSACLGCGQEDDHPKHVIAVDPTNLVRWHYDCHDAIAGCPDVCAPIVKSAKGKTGEELRTHLMLKKG